jgi:hypothetical protein
MTQQRAQQNSHVQREKMFASASSIKPCFCRSAASAASVMSGDSAVSLLTFDSHSMFADDAMLRQSCVWLVRCGMMLVDV